MATARSPPPPPPRQVQAHTAEHGGRYEGGITKNFLPQKGPSTGQVLAVVALLPVGSVLLALAGISLVGSMIALAISAPLFLLFSPVLVPAALAIGLAVTGILTSGAFGLTGLSSISWIINYFRQGRSVPEQMEYAKKRMQDVVFQFGQKTEDVGQTIQNKAHETGKKEGRTY